MSRTDAIDGSSRHSPGIGYCDLRAEKRTTTTTSKDKMKLFVGNLGDDGNITSGDLRPLFEQYGTVTECAKSKTTTYA